MELLPKACVIGAGPSGMSTIKALKAAGVPFDCFDKSDNIGGNWYYNNPNGMSSAYKTLQINTSKERMQYSDFPMPAHWPDFCHHSQVLEYFHAYCDHFGLREHITFNTAVEKAERTADGLWNVTLDTGETRRYDALVVCNGHHWDPQWPEPPFPGTFDGEVLHAHDFKTAEPWRDKRIVILGMGNSAMDIAVESSYLARAVYLAARRGAHIVPRYLWGKPLDARPLPHWAPFWLLRAVMGFMLRLQIGRVEHYGLPKPDHKVGEAHPTISSTILDRIGAGAVIPKPNIAELKGDRIRFVDGSEVAADVLVYCTGYKVSFPFFDPDFLAAPNNDLPLFQRWAKPDIPNLFFVGLFQPLGAIFPINEVQGLLIADCLRGHYHPPSPDAMQARIQHDRRRMFRRYVRSPRHTMQVDYDAFLHELRTEHAAGQRRAATNGHAPVIPPRA